MSLRKFVRRIRDRPVIQRIRFCVILLLLYLGFVRILQWKLPIYQLDEDSGSKFMELEQFSTIKRSDVPAIKKSIWNATLIHEPKPICASKPQTLVGKVKVAHDQSWIEINSANTDVTLGGRYTPPKCTSRHKVAIIIPLRDMESQLRVLLAHMHPIWKRQDFQYKVYVITQRDDALFNRAKLLNIGVAEARKDEYFDCYVFHDVDILLEDDNCLYWCHDSSPRHVSMHIDRFSYEPLLYKATCSEYGKSATMFQNTVEHFQSGPTLTYIGGVFMLTSEQFDHINGLSNLYWGRGGENDDLYIRLKTRDYTVSNPYGKKCSFTKLQHDHGGSVAGVGHDALLRYASMRMLKEGFNTLQYQVNYVQEHPLYTNITVDVGQPSDTMKEYFSRTLSSYFKCFADMPWKMVLSN